MGSRACRDREGLEQCWDVWRFKTGEWASRPCHFTEVTGVAPGDTHRCEVISGNVETGGEVDGRSWGGWAGGHEHKRQMGCSIPIRTAIPGFPVTRGTALCPVSTGPYALSRTRRRSSKNAYQPPLAAAVEQMKTTRLQEQKAFALIREILGGQLPVPGPSAHPGADTPTVL